MSGWNSAPSSATPGMQWGAPPESTSIGGLPAPSWGAGSKSSATQESSSGWDQMAKEMEKTMSKDPPHSNGSQQRGYQNHDAHPSRETSQQRGSYQRDSYHSRETSQPRDSYQRDYNSREGSQQRDPYQRDYNSREASQQRDSYRSRDAPGPRDEPSQDRRYSPPPPDDEPVVPLEDVWPGFVEADQSRDFDDVKPALARLCEAFTGKNWSDLEQKLRDEGCNTYLVATEDPVSFGYTLVNLRREPNQRYRVIPSFIKPGTVKSGRMALGVASSYEENLARLDDAGVVRPSGIPKCHNCKQEGHITSACPEEKREVERSKNFGKCYNCGAEDHRTRTCSQPRRSLSCRNCGADGHMAKDCQAPPTCRRCNEEGHTSRDCTQRDDIVCRRCEQPGHMARDCLEPPVLNCRRCNQEGHMVRDCPEPRTDMTCNRCGEVGHFARDCPQKERERSFVCHNCGQEGHMSRECTAPKVRKCNICGEDDHLARECPSGDGRSCNRCGQPGHMMRDCSESLNDVMCRSCRQPGHIARECPDRPQRQSSMTCFQCGEDGHRASECTSGGGGSRYNGDRRRPSRFGFRDGF